MFPAAANPRREGASDLDEANWAAAHYRVERETSGLKMSKRQRRRVVEQSREYGDPIPEQPRDVVRIYDREGAVVFERDWGMDRAGAVRQEARIVDDLLHLDVLSFRAAYGIAAPGEDLSLPFPGGGDGEGDGAS